MLYTFRCQKPNCGQKFDQSMALSIYERYKAKDFYEVMCPRCGTKRPHRHFDAMSAPAYHRDVGTFDPRTAPAALAGRSYNSKDEKKDMVKKAMGPNFVVGEVDRDKTITRPSKLGVVNITAKQAKANLEQSSQAPPKAQAPAVAPDPKVKTVSKGGHYQDIVVAAYRDASKPMAVKVMRKKLGLTYNQVYQSCTNTGMKKVRSGVFQYVPPESVSASA